jgi:hypothetical protein
MRVTIEQLHQHVFELWGREDGIRWDTNGFGGKADLVTGTIRIPPIRSEAAYAVALHEIGHIRCQHLDKEAVGAEEVACEILTCERRAWEWARDNALIWTPTMERAAEAGIGHYEARLAGKLTEYFYERVLALVNDLCEGGNPDGPEIWYALVRNACELAEMYEEPAEVLINLIDQYFAKPNPAFMGGRPGSETMTNIFPAPPPVPLSKPLDTKPLDASGVTSVWQPPPLPPEQDVPAGE